MTTETTTMATATETTETTETATVETTATETPPETTVEDSEASTSLRVATERGGKPPSRRAGNKLKSDPKPKADPKPKPKADPKPVTPPKTVIRLSSHRMEDDTRAAAATSAEALAAALSRKKVKGWAEIEGDVSPPPVVSVGRGTPTVAQFEVKADGTSQIAFYPIVGRREWENSGVVEPMMRVPTRAIMSTGRLRDDGTPECVYVMAMRDMVHDGAKFRVAPEYEGEDGGRRTRTFAEAERMSASAHSPGVVVVNGGLYLVPNAGTLKTSPFFRHGVAPMDAGVRIDWGSPSDMPSAEYVSANGGRFEAAAYADHEPHHARGYISWEAPPWRADAAEMGGSDGFQSLVAVLAASGEYLKLGEATGGGGVIRLHGRNVPPHKALLVNQVAGQIPGESWIEREGWTRVMVHVDGSGEPFKARFEPVMARNEDYDRYGEGHACRVMRWNTGIAVFAQKYHNGTMYRALEAVHLPTRDYAFASARRMDGLPDADIEASLDGVCHSLAEVVGHLMGVYPLTYRADRDGTIVQGSIAYAVDHVTPNEARRLHWERVLVQQSSRFSMEKLGAFAPSEHGYAAVAPRLGNPVLPENFVLTDDDGDQPRDPSASDRWDD